MGSVRDAADLSCTPPQHPVPAATATTFKQPPRSRTYPLDKEKTVNLALPLEISPINSIQCESMILQATYVYICWLLFYVSLLMFQFFEEY